MPSSPETYFTLETNCKVSYLCGQFGTLSFDTQNRQKIDRPWKNDTRSAGASYIYIEPRLSTRFACLDWRAIYGGGGGGGGRGVKE